LFANLNIDLLRFPETNSSVGSVSPGTIEPRSVLNHSVLYDDGAAMRVQRY
jgi:hypothetical protein